MRGGRHAQQQQSALASWRSRRSTQRLRSCRALLLYSQVRFASPGPGISGAISACMPHCGTVSLCGCGCATEFQAEWQPPAAAVPEACELTKTEPGLEEDLLSLEGISMEQVLQNGTPLLASGGQVSPFCSPHVTCSVVA